MQSFRLFVHPILLVLALVISGQAHSAFVTFTDRATWRAAAGGGVGDLSENFNSFTEDTFYGPPHGPVSAGFLTLDLINGANDTSWLIDVPADSGDRFTSLPNVNGTPFATAIGYQGVGTQADTLLSFGNVKALGFDYKDGSYGDSDGILTTSLGDTVPPLTNVNSTEIFFLGLLYTEGEVFSSLSWDPVERIGYGITIDDVEAYSAVSINPVPVPAAVWLFGTALIGLVGFSKRRKAA